MRLGLGVAALLLSAASAFAQTSALPDVPTLKSIANRDALMKPFPNPEWDIFDRTAFAAVEVAPGLFTFNYRDTRTIFLVTPDGVIVADPINPRAALLMRQAIRQITDKPVRYVVYSHYHWDHIRGAALFKAEGAVIMAHKNCAAHFAARQAPDVTPPDVYFGDTLRLELGGRHIDLMHFGPSHSDCLTLMQPDSGDYLFVVDLVTPRRMPMGLMADTFIDGTISTLEAIEKLNYRAIIPGHGPPVAHRSAATERLAYLQALVATGAQALKEAGANPQQAYAARVPAFDYLRGYERDIVGNVERILNYHYIGW
jgi:glyoxylase-like metal-dependent hydrolase (beta-lactamase superfamily II)